MKKFIMHEDDAVIPDRDLFLVRHTKHDIFSRYHYHDYFEFFIMIDGSLTEMRNSGQEVLVKGDCLLIRPGDSHGYPEWRREKFTFYNMAFRKSLWTELTQLYPALPWKQLTDAELPIMSSMNDKDFDFCLYSLDWILRMEEREHIHLAGLNFLSRMAIQFWFHELEEWRDDAPSWLQKTIAQLNDQRFLKEGIPFLRKEIPVSYEHFSRIFKKHTSRTPAEYLKQKRTRLARALLEGSDMTVGEIAAECGYDNLSHFHHQFKEECALSPLRYRKHSTAAENSSILIP